MPSLSGALFSSVSGLDVTSTAISVIGDNIANVNTPGFKERRAEFADVLGETISSVAGFSFAGAGSSVTRITSMFSQGTFEETARPTDLAIEGSGFFILDSNQGRFYSRAGVFTVDAAGAVVSPEGLRVQGFGIDPLTGSSDGSLGDITVSTAMAPPRATTEANLSVNLEAAATVFPGGFDSTDVNGSSSFRAPVTFYDSLGNAHTSTIFFTKTAANSWEWNAALNPADTTIAAGAGEEVVVQGGGTLTFDTSGMLTAVTGSPVTFEFSGGGAASQVIDLDFGPVLGVGTGDLTTQFAAPSATNSLTQDGFSSGSLNAITIDREGFITGQFSNGEVLPLARIALASFPNVEGLATVGGNNLIQTRTSGQALIGAAETGGFGAIRSSSLEQSTVDLASQFVRLIVNQRAFQANTRAISVANELMANLVSIGS